MKTYDNMGRFQVVRNGLDYSVIDTADENHKIVLRTRDKGKAWREAGRRSCKEVTSDS